MIERFARYTTYRFSEDAIRDLSSKYNANNVYIYYGSNTYNHSVEHVMELCNAVKADYPEVELKDIEVRSIGKHESDRHANMTMVIVGIPVDDYIRMCNENKIHVL